MLIRSGLILSGLILSGGLMLAQIEITPLTPEALRGQTIYQGKGNCASCHRIKGVGARTGPDLSEAGARRPEQLTTKLLTPDAEINAANRPYRVTLKNGTAVNGRLLNLDTFTVQMLDDKENLRSFVKTDLKEYVFVEKSPMPSYKDKLSVTRRLPTWSPISARFVLQARDAAVEAERPEPVELQARLLRARLEAPRHPPPSHIEEFGIDVTISGLTTRR